MSRLLWQVQTSSLLKFCLLSYSHFVCHGATLLVRRSLHQRRIDFFASRSRMGLSLSLVPRIHEKSIYFPCCIIRLGIESYGSIIGLFISLDYFHEDKVERYIVDSLWTR